LIYYLLSPSRAEDGVAEQGEMTSTSSTTSDSHEGSDPTG
jgi:hypothetical protein